MDFDAQPGQLAALGLDGLLSDRRRAPPGPIVLRGPGAYRVALPCRARPNPSGSYHERRIGRRDYRPGRQARFRPRSGRAHIVPTARGIPSPSVALVQQHRLPQGRLPRANRPAVAARIVHEGNTEDIEEAALSASGGGRGPRVSRIIRRPMAFSRSVSRTSGERKGSPAPPGIPRVHSSWRATPPRRRSRDARRSFPTPGHPSAAAGRRPKSRAKHTLPTGCHSPSMPTGR